MPTSEARQIANRMNAAKSTGPKTPEGKERSRANSFKHGMTGAGVVLPNEDAAEVDRRFAAFEAELAPSTEMGRTLTRRVATLAVRLDRCVAQETAALSERVRQAEADFLAPEGLDEDEVGRLRQEAGRRAMFDPSPEATLARKYEAAAERGLFRALKELRQVESEAKAPSQPAMDESFRQMLASFSEVDRMAAEIEADYPEVDLPAPSKPSRPAPPAWTPPNGDAFEVPFSIGRAR